MDDPTRPPSADAPGPRVPSGPVTAPARLAEIAELLRPGSPGAGRFLRGVVIGAVIGAVLAGLGALRRRARD